MADRIGVMVVLLDLVTKLLQRVQQCSHITEQLELIIEVTSNVRQSDVMAGETGMMFNPDRRHKINITLTTLCCQRYLG